MNELDARLYVFLILLLQVIVIARVPGIYGSKPIKSKGMATCAITIIYPTWLASRLNEYTQSKTPW